MKDIDDGAHQSPLKIIKAKQKISFDEKKTTFVLDGFFETPFITIFLKRLNRDFTCTSIPYVMHVYIISFIIMPLEYVFAGLTFSKENTPQDVSNILMITLIISLVIY